MNSTSAVKRRREGALERLKKSGSKVERVVEEMKTLQTRIAASSKHRKYLRRKPSAPKVPAQPTESKGE